MPNAPSGTSGRTSSTPPSRMVRPAPAAAQGAPAATVEGVAPKGSPARPTREVPKTPAVWIATAFGLGFGPWAPGTWGALGTVLLFSPIFAGLGMLGYGALVVAEVLLADQTDPVVQRELL